MVIAIASSIEERARLAGALDGSVVLLVSSPAEALQVLSGAVGAPARGAAESLPHGAAESLPHGAAESLPHGAAESLPRPADVPGPREGTQVSVMRPAETKPAAPTPLRAVTGLEVDSDWRVARCADREVRLTPLEHDLLVCLLDRDGHIETFESLQRRVWGNDHLGGRSHVQSVVKRLRRKLENLRSPLQIDAVRGVGLRLVDTSYARGRQEWGSS